MERFTIHCDLANNASAKVASKAGFRHVENHPVSGPRTEAQSGVEMLWVLEGTGRTSGPEDRTVATPL